MGKFLLAVACLCLLPHSIYSQQPVDPDAVIITIRLEEPTADPTAAKLTAAKENFNAERDQAKQALLDNLKRKQAAAKQAGDLNTLEALTEEIEAFRQAGTLPKNVPVNLYEAALKTARTKLESVYAATINAHLKNNELDKAKALQAELDKLIKGSMPAADPVQANTVWKNDNGNQILVSRREGAAFYARYSWGKGNGIREVKGTVNGDKAGWLGKDAKNIKGIPGGDNVGTLVRLDDGGYKWVIDFTDADGKTGSFTVWLQK